jgi:general secretion pathway protein A
MYTAFYGLDEKPFTLSPDPRYLFLSATHREVLGHLIYGIEQGEGFIAISGEVGTGKTTLCRTLLERLGNESEVAFLFNPQLAPRELLRAINTEFGLPTESESLTELTQHLNDFLVRKHAEGRRVLLIVDEAQTLSPETLEQIRLLSNLETSRSKLLQIVLLGQPELEEKLGMTELRQLRQRITVWWQLGPMTATETRDYVLHRLRIAGAQQTLFSDAALAEVHRVSRGVPRVINVLCDRALLAGYSENRAQIDRNVVQEVAREIGPSTGAAPARRSPGRALQAAAVLLVLAVGFLAGRSFDPPAPAPAPPAPRAGTQGGPQAPMPRVDAAPLPTPAPAPASTPASTPQRVAAAVPPPLPEPPPAPAAGPEDETSVVVVAPVTRLASDLPVAPRRSDVLDMLLPSRTSPHATAGAIDAALEAWRLPATGSQSLYMADALAILNEQGLRPHWVQSTGVETLEYIDLPTLVLLQRDDEPARWSLLRRIEAEEVELQGLLPGETVRVGRHEFLRRWTGQGYIVWRDFEGLPRSLALGQTGKGVDWLQQALGDLGYMTGARSGVFDAATGLAVREFQRAAALPPDGVVGPQTKIRLYQALPGYVMPSLGGAPVDLATRRATPGT